MLPESEAKKLAIVFEETAKYQREQQKKAESQNSGYEHGGSGVEGAWEADFEFGSEDENDYWDRPDITKGQPIT